MRYLLCLIMCLAITGLSAREGRNVPREPGRLTVRVTRLARTDSLLQIDLEVELSGRTVNRRQSYMVIPELRCGDNSVRAAGFLVNGIIRERIGRRKVSPGNGLPSDTPHINAVTYFVGDSLVRYSLRMPYEAWMEGASLDIHQLLISPAGVCKSYVIAGVARVSPRQTEAAQVTPRVSFIEPGTEQRQGYARIDYPLGSSVIDPSYGNNSSELQKIERIISELAEDPDVRITGLTLKGYASPEGPYSLNERLALGRTVALKEWLEARWVPGDMSFQVSAGAEDWDGVVEWLRASDMEGRQETLRMIGATEDPDAREKNLKKLDGGSVWNLMLKRLFPSLRRVEYTVSYFSGRVDIERTASRYKTDPGSLSAREMYLLAESFGHGSEEYDRILLELMPRYYPENEDVLINVAARLTELGDLHSAGRYLKKCPDSPAVLNNRGVLHLLAGETETAGALFREALARGNTEAEHNLGEAAKVAEMK